jgi:hypothetical protein
MIIGLSLTAALLTALPALAGEISITEDGFDLTYTARFAPFEQPQGSLQVVRPYLDPAAAPPDDRTGERDGGIPCSSGCRAGRPHEHARADLVKLDVLVAGCDAAYLVHAFVRPRLSRSEQR